MDAEIKTQAKQEGFTAIYYPADGGLWMIRSDGGLTLGYKTDVEILAFLNGLKFIRENPEHLAHIVPSAVVVSGNPFDGMTISGPFGDFDDASEWAERNTDESWWTVNLENPLD